MNCEAHKYLMEYEEDEADARRRRWGGIWVHFEGGNMGRIREIFQKIENKEGERARVWGKRSVWK